MTSTLNIPIFNNKKPLSDEAKTFHLQGWENIIFSDTHYEISNSLVSEIIFCFNIVHAPVCGCLIKLGKLFYLETILNNIDNLNFTPDQRYYFNSFMSNFFNIDLIAFLHLYYPQGVSPLLEFQNKYISPEFLWDAQFAFSRFIRFYKELPNTEAQYHTLISVFNLTSLIHPLTINNDIRLIDSFHIHHSKIILKLLTHTPNFPDLRDQLITLLFQFDETSLVRLYQDIKSQFLFLKLERFEPLVPTLSILFTNPVLCATAFKNNNPKLISLCNVPQCMSEHPQLFIS